MLHSVRVTGPASLIAVDTTPRHGMALLLLENAGCTICALLQMLATFPAAISKMLRPILPWPQPASASRRRASSATSDAAVPCIQAAMFPRSVPACMHMGNSRTAPGESQQVLGRETWGQGAVLVVSNMERLWLAGLEPQWVEGPGRPCQPMLLDQAHAMSARACMGACMGVNAQVGGNCTRTHQCITCPHARATPKQGPVCRHPPRHHKAYTPGQLPLIIQLQAERRTRARRPILKLLAACSIRART